MLLRSAGSVVSFLLLYLFGIRARWHCAGQRQCVSVLQALALSSLNSEQLQLQRVSPEETFGGSLKDINLFSGQVCATEMVCFVSPLQLKIEAHFNKARIPTFDESS